MRGWGRWGGTTWVVIYCGLLVSVFLAGVAASGTAFGVILVLIGQQVLLAANSDGSPWSVSLADVACIGAVGGAICSTPFVLYAAKKILAGHPIPAPGIKAGVLYTVVIGPAFATTSGAIGASIFGLHGGSVLSVGKASEAGVIGYVVLLAAVIALSVAAAVICIPALVCYIVIAWIFEYCRSIGSIRR